MKIEVEFIPRNKNILMLYLMICQTQSENPCCENNERIIMTETEVKCETSDKFIPLYNECQDFFYLKVDPTNYESEVQKYIDTYINGSQKRHCSGLGVNASDPESHQFHAFICFEDTAEDQPQLLYTISQVVSVVFIILTLVVYWMLPELRDIQDKSVMCFIGSLGMGYIILTYVQFYQTVTGLQCVIIGFLVYFWFLSSFFWLHINCFNVWRSSVLGHIQWEESRLFIYYIGAGWGFPLLFLIVAMITHNMPGSIIRPNFGERSCWFAGNVELWSFFYGPVAFLLIGNILYFLSTACHLWSDYETPNIRLKSLRYKFALYLRLYLAMGITWIFEIISYIYPGSLWMVTDILNCLQGVIIFIVMIATRRRVWRGLARRKPFGISFGRHWETLHDVETEYPIEVAEGES
uniref:G-protein coupled receptors family 2 profile 2 domain-containing protein n=1 Tax=Clastoptera arizonana TaxID=38151 RepID=A0A1B6CQ85_9HEMI